MSGIDGADRLFKFLLKCQRNKNVPDLHSFTVDITGGNAFVECRGYDEVFIETHLFGENGDRKSRWVGTTMAAANRLEMLGADFSTIDM